MLNSTQNELKFGTIFFQTLSQSRFSCLEKIKTTGSTYMAASGLTKLTSLPRAQHVCAVADFVFAMRAQLADVNRHSFNNFTLRVGKSKF